MPFISAFDVLGPNMIGPSSAHTAGAAVIAELAQKMMPPPLKRVEFTLYGSFAKTYRGHGTDWALLGGILGVSTDNRNIRDSFEIARQRGLEFIFTPNETETEVHPNAVESAWRTLLVMCDGAGRVPGRGQGAHLPHQRGADFTGDYSTVIVVHQDKPGVVAHITKVL